MSQLTGNLGQVCGEESIIQIFSSETLNYCVNFASRGEDAEAGGAEELLG